MTTSAPADGWYARPAARDRVGPGPGAGGSGAGDHGARVRAFHRSLPGYAPTPLLSRPALAAELGVGAVLVKDESARLGLPAFKVLGASWAVARVIAGRTGSGAGADPDPPDPPDLPGLRRAAAGSGIRLVTATDGNHGRAVARMAALLGLSATVFAPPGLTGAAAAAITAEGADLVRTGGDYDQAVLTAARFVAGHPQRELVQDTAWAGYQQVPAWIVEGYQTMLAEVDEQLEAASPVAEKASVAPDLVAVPVGVGSLAQAVLCHYRRPGAVRPVVLSVEPETAACVLASLVAGTPLSVPTAATVMAGLNCGTVSSTAWPVLRDGCDAAVAVTDAAARQASADLGRLGISSGPSGAAALAGVRAALARPERRAALGIGATSTVVLLSTEGAPPA